MESARYRLIITGKVQGVYYRAWTSSTAQESNLKGWVRNLPDGSVEAVIEGAKEDVDQMIAKCHQGPSRAKVDRVECTIDQSGEVLSNFTIR